MIRVMEARGHQHGDSRWDRGDTEREDDQTAGDRQGKQMSGCVFIFLRKSVVVFH